MTEAEYSGTAWSPAGTVGIIGGWYTTMDTPSFWLLHVGTAVAGLIGFVLFKLVDMMIGLRVPREEERQGLDQTSHGESAYNY